MILMNMPQNWIPILVLKAYKGDHSQHGNKSHFTAGLKGSMYDYAIDRIQQQVERWQEWDPVLPTQLKLSSLPMT